MALSSWASQSASRADQISEVGKAQGAQARHAGHEVERACTRTGFGNVLSTVNVWGILN